MMKILVLLLLFTSIGTFAKRSSKRPKIEARFHTPMKTQTFENFLHYELGISWYVIHTQDYLNKLVHWNPLLKSRRKVTRKDKLYIEVPYRSIKRKRYKVAEINYMGRDGSRLPAGKIQYKRKRRTKKMMDYNSFLTAFYTFSKGNFEESSGGITTTTSQDSPITFGVAGRYIFNKKFTLSSSMYFSKLDPAAVNDDTSVNLPLEIGATTHIDYTKYSYMPFFGFDYEKFATFNTDELGSGEELRIREHTLIYASVGFSKTFNLRSRKFFMKVGLSQSISSESAQKSIISDDVFTGNKIIFYLNTAINKNVSSHLLIKRHNLTGPTELAITRIGLGLGYNF